MGKLEACSPALVPIPRIGFVFLADVARENENKLLRRENYSSPGKRRPGAGPAAPGLRRAHRCIGDARGCLSFQLRVPDESTRDTRLVARLKTTPYSDARERGLDRRRPAALALDDLHDFFGGLLVG